jgi:hypothetical protein
MAPIARGVARRHRSPGEAVYRLGRLTASYVHLYFPSNPDAAATGQKRSAGGTFGAGVDSPYP